MNWKKIPGWLPAAVLLALTALFSWLPNRAAAQPSAASPGAEAGQLETWREGVLSQENPAYSAVSGRLLSQAPAFKLSQFLNGAWVDDLYHIFPASARSQTVTEAQVLLLSDSLAGYPGTVDLTLDVYTFPDTFQRTLSAAPVNLAAQPARTWISIPLVDACGAACALARGEYLVGHLHLSQSSTEVMELQFEVKVR